MMYFNELLFYFSSNQENLFCLFYFYFLFFQVWFYQDMGSMYYDQCQNAAATRGASIITPYTVGLTGDNYWLTSTHQCNTYEYIYNSGYSMGNENVGSGVRSSPRSEFINL